MNRDRIVAGASALTGVGVVAMLFGPIHVGLGVAAAGLLIGFGVEALKPAERFEAATTVLPTLAIALAAQDARAEAERAAGKFAPFNSSHEFYGVFAEEAHELMLALHANDRAGLLAEAKQCAAVCLRFIAESSAQDAQARAA